jgi:hypothetical protein
MIPKSGNRFSEKIMLKQKHIDLDPIQLNWIKGYVPLWFDPIAATAPKPKPRIGFQ